MICIQYLKNRLNDQKAKTDTDTGRPNNNYIFDFAQGFNSNKNNDHSPIDSNNWKDNYNNKDRNRDRNNFDNNHRYANNNRDSNRGRENTGYQGQNFNPNYRKNGRNENYRPPHYQYKDNFYEGLSHLIFRKQKNAKRYRGNKIRHI